MDFKGQFLGYCLSSPAGRNRCLCPAQCLADRGHSSGVKSDRSLHPLASLVSSGLIAHDLVTFGRWQMEDGAIPKCPTQTAVCFSVKLSWTTLKVLELCFSEPLRHKEAGGGVWQDRQPPVPVSLEKLKKRSCFSMRCKEQ